MTTIIGTAKAFVVKRVAVSVDRLFKVANPRLHNDTIAYNTYINTDAIHALPISVLCCLIEERKGSKTPKASLVVAVEPTMEPTAPAVLINAGYTMYISGLTPGICLIWFSREPVMLTIKATNMRVKRNSLIVLMNSFSAAFLTKI